MNISAGDDVTLESAITSGTLIDVNAGAVGGTGGISGNIFTELLTTGGGNINLTAGATGGNISLADSSLSTTGSVSLVAAGGSITHGGGTIVAADLYARSAMGIAANTRTGSIDAAISGDGNLFLTNGGDLVLDSVIASNGSIEIINFGRLTANRVETFGTTDDNDILLTTHAVGQTDSDLNFTVIRAGGAGDVTLNVEGGINPLATSAEPNPTIVGDVLSIVVRGGLDLSTQVNELIVETTAAGDVEIDEADGLVLKDIEIADGGLSVVADGNLVAQDVRLASNAGDRNISLETTTGDIEIGFVKAGVYAADAAAADAIQLGYFNAALRAIGEIQPGDPDRTLAQARDIDQDPDYSQIRSDLIAMLEADGASSAEASAEADAILSLETLLTSLGAISLTASGAIREMAAVDDDVDLIADQVTLTAGGDITGLEIAVDRIVDVSSASGSIDLADLDGVDEKKPGLVVMSASSQSTDNETVAISTQGDLKVGRLNSSGIIDTGSVGVGGANSSLELVSTGGNLIVYEGGGLAVSGSIRLEAAGLVRAPDLPTVSDRVEIRAGTTFDFAALNRLDITADTIIIETGKTIDADGTLAARDLVELVSNAGNVIVSGTITGIGGDSLAQLDIESNGIGTTTQYLLDGKSGFVRFVDSAGNAYLGDLADDPADNLFYSWQDPTTGRYSFSGLNALTGQVETFFSASTNPSSGTLYLADNQTPVDTASVSNLSPVYLQVNDQATIDDLTPVTEIVPVGNVYLRGSGDMEAVDTSLTALNGKIRQTTDRIVTATTFSAQAATGIDLVTDVDIADLLVTGDGDILLDEADGITLQNVSVANGAITVDAAGTVTVGELVSLTDSADNDLAITTTAGDILVDSILMGGSESGVALTAYGDIKETNYFDPDPGTDQDPSFDPDQDPYLDIGANSPLLLSTGGGSVYHNVLYPPDDDGDVGLEISSAAVT
ncbi:MAG: hypothetical protein PVJ78_16420, partial [Gammaproteobacteria bacterium]